ncbi:MAG: DinB family protein [Planctomycetota bacterium]
MPATDLAREFTAYARGKLAQHLAQIERCVALLGPDELWQRANAHSNSIGNLILHLQGNVRQWILAGLAGEEFKRDRPAEFAERGPLPAAQVVGALRSTVQRAMSTISALDERSLPARRTIQGYEVSALAAVFHVVEHFAGHAGQIVYATKVLKDVDLSQYDPHGRKQAGDTQMP